MQKVKETLNQNKSSVALPPPVGEEAPKRKIIIRKKTGALPRGAKSLSEDDSKMKHVKVRVRRPPHLAAFPQTY